MNSRELTYATLVKLRACGAFRRKFHRLLGGKVQITSALAIKHHKDFSLSWAAENLLSSSAWAEYRKARDAAWAEYEKVCAVLAVNADAVTRAEYTKVMAGAWAEYQNANAVAWAEAYINDKEPVT